MRPAGECVNSNDNCYVRRTAAILTALPIIALFLLAQKQFAQGIASAGLKG
jgi:ABC-type maltose transport system permease subunit